MKNELVIWRKIMGMIFGRYKADKEDKRIEQSYKNPVVAIHLRDSFRYYEKGRWVTVSGELMGSGNVERLVYRNCTLNWNDLGPPLTLEERAKVFLKIGGYLDEMRIR